MERASVRPYAFIIDLVHHGPEVLIRMRGFGTVQVARVPARPPTVPQKAIKRSRINEITTQVVHLTYSGHHVICPTNRKRLEKEVADRSRSGLGRGKIGVALRRFHGQGRGLGTPRRNPKSPDDPFLVSALLDLLCPAGYSDRLVQCRPPG